MLGVILEVLGIIFILLIIGFIFLVVKQVRKKTINSGKNSQDKEKLKKENISSEASNIETLNDVLIELNNLEGLEDIKLEVNELVSVLKYDLEEGSLDLQSITLHYVFSGNPGTGKTTVARLIAKIYKTLGILESGQLVEVDRSDLVAGFIGQTAIQTKKKVEDAIGGVLFIDEAYALTGRGNSDFGNEAVETLLKLMEDYKGQFMVIVAGYTNEMQEFLSSNPGLKSRFDKEFVFRDYNTESLSVIAKKILDDKGKEANLEVYNLIKDYLSYVKNQNLEGFGNAREVRKIIAEAVKNQKIRLSKIPADQRTDEMKKSILLEDLEEFKLENLPRIKIEEKRSSIGYDYNDEN